MEDLFESIDFFADTTDETVKRLQNEAEKLVKDSKVIRRFLEKQHNKVSSFSELSSLPQKNEQIRIITQQSMNAYALLLYIVESTNIQECYLTTYNMDKNTIQGLRAMVDSGIIQKLTLVISDSVNFRMPDRASELKKIAGNGISLIFCWNHTKIILAKSDKNYYVIEGSGNLSDNARIEQYLIEDCEETYNFHKNWIDEIKTKDYKRISIHE